MALNIVTPPAVEPVTTAEAKDHVIVTASGDDTLIDSYIKSARQEVERYCNRALVQQTLSLTLDAFPPVIHVPRPPLISVSSITYVDDNGVTQTLSSSLYQVAAAGEPARIVPAYGEVWPTTRNQLEAVVVTFVCGYLSSSSPQVPAENVPEPIKEAIKMMVAESYENREAAIVGTIHKINPRAMEKISNYKVWMPVS